jgi:hypothetical protein
MTKYSWRDCDNIQKLKSFCSFDSGESLIQWVKVMYSNPRYKIVDNGYLSESIELLRGVKQGLSIVPISIYYGH